MFANDTDDLPNVYVYTMNDQHDQYVLPNMFENMREDLPNEYVNSTHDQSAEYANENVEQNDENSDMSEDGQNVYSEAANRVVYWCD